MFKNVDPEFKKNAQEIEAKLIGKLAEITQFTPDTVRSQIDDHAFEIAHAMVTDLCYLAKNNGINFIALLATTLNKVLNPQFDDKENNAASLNWILNGISDLKYTEVEEIVETAQSLLEEASSETSDDDGE